MAALTFRHTQQRDGRWCIVDLVGKHGRVRTVPTNVGQGRPRSLSQFAFNLRAVRASPPSPTVAGTRGLLPVAAAVAAVPLPPHSAARAAAPNDGAWARTRFFNSCDFEPKCRARFAAEPPMLRSMPPESPP